MYDKDAMKLYLDLKIGMAHYLLSHHFNDIDFIDNDKNQINGDDESSHGSCRKIHYIHSNDTEPVSLL